MNDIAIKVENLGKKYVINHENGKNDDNFREVIIGNSKKLFNKLNPFNHSIEKESNNNTEDFWALNDVNFEIKKGDKVGIIGRNGAGKSTLLKVLSRITEPTTGKIHINGRLASLLEVGTGFHPELTGRENIYLNGAILGMSRKEIKAKFDEIVAFAEVDKFLDTPVKRYSSGMYVRLAFSVAAHLEPEILVIDEVLAVGDAAFQKKCLGKMDDVAKDGRTILFVSHNLSQIQKLCNVIIYLDGGKLDSLGESEIILNKYNQTINNKSKSIWSATNESAINGPINPIELKIFNESNSMLNVVNRKVFKSSSVSITFDVKEKLNNLTLGYSLFDSQQNLVYRSLFTDHILTESYTLDVGRYNMVSELPLDILNEGQYLLVLDGSIYKKYWLFNPSKDQSVSISFEIQNRFSSSHYWQDKRAGIISPAIKWEIENEVI